jgi:hypothetical protein
MLLATFAGSLAWFAAGALSLGSTLKYAVLAAGFATWCTSWVVAGADANSVVAKSLTLPADILHKTLAFMD